MKLVFEEGRATLIFTTSTLSLFGSTLISNYVMALLYRRACYTSTISWSFAIFVCKLGRKNFMESFAVPIHRKVFYVSRYFNSIRENTRDVHVCQKNTDIRMALNRLTHWFLHLNWLSFQIKGRLKNINFWLLWWHNRSGEVFYMELFF